MTESINLSDVRVREVLGLPAADPDVLKRFGPATYTPEQVLEYARRSRMTHPANEQPKLDLEATDLRAALHTALCEYRLSNMGCEDEAGAPYPLIDLCSNDGTDISTGREELFNLADFLASDPTVLALIARVQEGEEKPTTTFTPVVGMWKDQSMSRLERVRAHRFEFGSDLRAAIDAVDEEAARQALSLSPSTPKAGDEGELSAWLRMMSEDSNVHPADQKRLLAASQRLASTFSRISRDRLIALISGFLISDGAGWPLQDDATPADVADAILTLTAGASNAEGGDKAKIEAAEPFFKLAREVITPSNGERPWHADSKDWMVVFSFAGQSVTLGDLRRAAAVTTDGGAGS